MIHDLKCWPQFFVGVVDGSKPFELRRDDRDYRVGDTLRLREWYAETETYTGRECCMLVTCIVSGGPWLAPGYVAMGLAKLGADGRGERT